MGLRAFSPVRTTILAIACAIVLASPAYAIVYPGNGNTGFGGPIGDSANGASLTLTDNGSSLSFTVTRGPGAFNDYLVFYFDTQAGGATSLPTSGEIGSPFGGRRAIVNEFGSGISAFPALFGSDFAFVLAPNPSLGGNASNHLFTTPSGADANALVFVNTHTVTGFGSTTSATYSWTIPFSELNITAGQTFNFVTTYLNPLSGGGSDASFRSNEMYGPENPGANPGFANYSFTVPLPYTTTPIPETSTLVSALLAVAVVGWSQRRRLARMGFRAR